MIFFKERGVTMLKKSKKEKAPKEAKAPKPQKEKKEKKEKKKKEPSEGGGIVLSILTALLIADGLFIVALASYMAFLYLYTRGV